MPSFIADYTQEESSASWILSCHHQGSFWTHRLQMDAIAFSCPSGFRIGAGDVA